MTGQFRGFRWAIFRITQKESNGIQILLTDRVAGMQGGASSVISVLRRLREAAGCPLPPALPDGQFQQIEFSGN